MNGYDKTIEFFDVEPVQLYESIDIKLREAGGENRFKMLTQGTKVYAYDFPEMNADPSRIGTVMVFIPPSIQTSGNGDGNYMNTKTSSGSVMLMNFKQSLGYESLCNSLMELKTRQ